MKLIVQCTFRVEVDYLPDYDPDIFFNIEENHCPGTGLVGSAFDVAYEASDSRSTCWGCQLQGENEIIAVDGLPLTDARRLAMVEEIARRNK